MTIIEEITALLQGLSPARLNQARALIENLRREELDARTAAWSFDFLEQFGQATISASRNPAGMEIKCAEATCDGVTRGALWEHPPLSGSASVAYIVPIPSTARAIQLKFATGIRDGSELPADRFVAFRVMVNGWKLWGAVQNARVWQTHEIKMPQLGSDVVRIEFVTDGLGDHRWNWAVWGEPRLEGES